MSSAQLSSGNHYSPLWFALFLREIPPTQTAAECDFLARQLPQAAFTDVLDICCGMGRHAHALAARGYWVTGVDVDESALDVARRATAEDASEAARFVRADMRALGEASDLGDLARRFDAALLLWQSFGQFDDPTNLAVLRGVRERLRPGGRFILDIYHRGFFETHPEPRQFAHAGRTISETRTMDGARLTVRLEYGPDAPPDIYSWRLFTPEEALALGEEAGLESLLCCAGFDERRPASAAQPRMQLIFARP